MSDDDTARAERAIVHYTRLLAGSLSDKQRHTARLLLVRAVGVKVRAEMAKEEARDEVVVEA